MNRWAKIEHAFHSARGRSAEERARFLDEQCGTDAAMREQVEALLAQDDSPNSLLSQPLIDMTTGLPTIVARLDSLVGRSIGPYRVLEYIGSGGMGDVYRARDIDLNRDVALKVLPPIFVLDAERLARFKREAQLLASLNHPNIAAIYGFEESDDVRALALELVEGPTLADWLERGPMSIGEAVPAARQIADAIAAAHERGIVHRDLKPANIKLRPNGVLKVLDFGLAKLVEPAAEGTDPSATARPTITSPASAIGARVLLGTPAYMSPEQVKGKPADLRSDVWAFACVLYEMITARRAFAGDDVSDTLAAVLQGEPDWAALPADVPPILRTLLEGCLQKDRKACVGDIWTARFLLNGQRLASTGPSPMPAVRRWPSRSVAIAAIVLTIAGAGVVGVMSASRHETPQPVVRFSMPLGEGLRLSTLGRRQVAISPDGAQVVFAANRQLFVRPLSEWEARPIAGTLDTGSVTNPAFSPDGRSVAFWSGTDATIKRVAISGGVPVTICHASNPFGISWSGDDVLFGQGQEDVSAQRPWGIMRVRAAGGTPELMIKVGRDERASDPQMLPDNRGVLLTLTSGLRPLQNESDIWDKARIVVFTPQSNEPKTLFEGGRDARYVSAGHIVYAVGGTIFAFSLDLGRLERTGQPVSVLEGVARSGPAAPAQFDVSRKGSLIYFPGPSISIMATPFNLAFLDRNGKTERLTLPAGWYESPRVSQDGKRLAYATYDDKNADVWVYSLSEPTGDPRRLTFGGRNRFPVWSADGRFIAFQSDREGDLAIWRQPADVSGPSAERLTKPEPGTRHVPESWSPTGDLLSFSTEAERDSRYSLRLLSVGDKREFPLGNVESGLPAASEFSPDGRWIAYQKGEPHAPYPLLNSAIYVQPYPPTGPVIQVSSGNAGFKPMWLGNEIVYGVGAVGPRLQWVRAPIIATQPALMFGPAISVPSGDFVLGGGLTNSANLRNYSMAPDGKLIGIVRAVPASAPSTMPPDILQIVLNWSDELKQRLPAK
jgi:serine/threonine-protein kinase